MEALGIPSNWGGLGISGIILFAIFALFKGWLYPGSWVDRMLRAKDEIIKKQEQELERYKPLQPLFVKFLETLNSQAKTKSGDKPDE